MKNIIILHGTGESEQSFWFPYVKNQAEKLGYSVTIPLLPGADNPSLDSQLQEAMKQHYDSETILIGHSSGCPLAISVLENITTPIRQTIFVAGYIRPLNGETINPMLQKEYDWERINTNCNDFIFINSDNDPWGCDDIEGRYMLDHVGKGKLIIMKGEGHMGSDSFNQPYKEFPLLVQLIN